MNKNLIDAKKLIPTDFAKFTPESVVAFQAALHQAEAMPESTDAEANKKADAIRAAVNLLKNANGSGNGDTKTKKWYQSWMLWSIIIIIIALLAILAIWFFMFREKKHVFQVYATQTEGTVPWESKIIIKGNFLSGDLQWDENDPQGFDATKDSIIKNLYLSAAGDTGIHFITVRAFFKKDTLTETIMITSNVPVLPPDTTGNGGTPPASGNGTPPASGGGTPPASGNGTPPASGNGTPPASGGGTPPASGGGTPPASGGGTPPASGGNTNNGGNANNLTFNKTYTTIDAGTLNKWRSSIVNGNMTVNKADILLSYKYQDGGTTMVFLNLRTGANAPTKNVYININNLTVK